MLINTAVFLVALYVLVNMALDPLPYTAPNLRLHALYRGIWHTLLAVGRAFRLRTNPYAHLMNDAEYVKMKSEIEKDRTLEIRDAATARRVRLKKERIEKERAEMRTRFEAAEMRLATYAPDKVWLERSEDGNKYCICYREIFEQRGHLYDNRTPRRLKIYKNTGGMVGVRDGSHTRFALSDELNTDALIHALESADVESSLVLDTEFRTPDGTVPMPPEPSTTASQERTSGYQPRTRS